MINYRVDNLGELLEQLRAGGVAVLQGPESHENGKFAWIMDPDGNKIELWEPRVWDEKTGGVTPEGRPGGPSHVVFGLVCSLLPSRDGPDRDARCVPPVVLVLVPVFVATQCGACGC